MSSGKSSCSYCLRASPSGHPAAPAPTALSERSSYRLTLGRGGGGGGFQNIPPGLAVGTDGPRMTRAAMSHCLPFPTVLTEAQIPHHGLQPCPLHPWCPLSPPPVHPTFLLLQPLCPPAGAGFLGHPSDSTSQEAPHSHTASSPLARIFLPGTGFTEGSFMSLDCGSSVLTRRQVPQSRDISPPLRVPGQCLPWSRCSEKTWVNE